MTAEARRSAKTAPLTAEEFVGLDLAGFVAEATDALQGRQTTAPERERAAEPAPPTDGAPFPDAGPTGPDFYAPADDDPDAWRGAF